MRPSGTLLALLLYLLFDSAPVLIQSALTQIPARPLTAERNCEMAPSTSPAFNSRLPEFVAKSAACSLFTFLTISAPSLLSAAAPSLSPSCRSTAASVV